MSSVVKNYAEHRHVLPRNVSPSHYVVDLTPDLEQFTFHGSVDITLNIKESSSKIFLNAHELEIRSAKVISQVGKNEQTLGAIEVSHDTPRQTAILTFPQELPEGSIAILHLEFVGILNDQMAGFYRSAYVDQQGNKKYMGVTQFEATDARRAFPCWDEPSLKATFDIVLRVPSDRTALSNMNVISETNIPGTNLKEVKFATSPIMSTYLVAFAVGEYEYIEGQTSGPNPVTCRIYTLPGFKHQSEFSLNVATRTLEFFNEIFEIPYPLPKLDLIAIPDFAAGAMENWGLVTFRTILLLFDEKSSTTKAKQRIAVTVAHEIAHQWFGNLVTMEWWDHLWLNEGFATWVGTLAVAKLFPEWKVWSEFISADLIRGLELDSLRSTHPVEVQVADPAEITEIFDEISYSKGASLIRMLSSFLNEDVFLRGVKSYLKKFKYGNASTQDLWNSVSEESGQDVSQFMPKWTLQPGYPLVSIHEQENGVFQLQQRRYLSTGDINEAEDNQIWWVPLEIMTQNGQATSADLPKILLEKNMTFTLTQGSFLKLNRNYTGFYRVLYTSSQLQKLGEAVTQGGILSTEDRIGLINDIKALARSGEAKATDLLSLLGRFENETEYLVWQSISDALTDMFSVWFEESDQIIAQLSKIECYLFGNLVRKLGWEFQPNEDFLNSLLRSLAITRAGLSGDTEVVEESRRRFEKFVSGDESAIHPDLRSGVFQTILKFGGPTEYEALRKIYLETTITDQKLIALLSLASTGQPELFQRTLEFSLSEHVLPQDVIYIFRGSFLNTSKQNRYLFWEFFTSKYDQIEKQFKTSPLLGSLVKSVVRSFSSEQQLKEMNSFFANKDTKNYARALSQSLEYVSVNAKWLARDRDNVAEWLNSNSK